MKSITILNYFKIEEHEPYVYSDDIYEHFNKNVIQPGTKLYNEWNELFKKYQQEFPTETQKFIAQINNKFTSMKSILSDLVLKQNAASRETIKQIFEHLTKKQVEGIFVLSADIAKSTNVKTFDGQFNDHYSKNFLMAGIREHAMAAMSNGIALHGGLRPVCSTFLSFSDYMKPSIRLGAIQELNTTFMFTHDSVLIGSDGPTHQPVEQLVSMRSIPNNNVYRPADEIETKNAFIEAFDNHQISTFILSRQNLKSFNHTNVVNNKISADLIATDNSNVDLIILASGSEVEVALNTKEIINQTLKLNVNVYSVNNLNEFLNRNDLKNLLKAKYLVVIEASNDPTWYELYKYNKNLLRVGIYHYGKSMDGKQLYKDLGFDSNKIVERIKTELLQGETNE